MAEAARAVRSERLGAVFRGAFAALSIATAAAAGMAVAAQARIDVDIAPLEQSALVARGEVRFVGEAVERYAASHEQSCPPTLETLRDDGYLFAEPLDPWGEPLLYECVDSPHSFAVVSKGPDRILGTPDDLIYQAP